MKLCIDKVKCHHIITEQYWETGSWIFHEGTAFLPKMSSNITLDTGSLPKRCELFRLNFYYFEFLLYAWNDWRIGSESFKNLYQQIGT